MPDKTMPNSFEEQYPSLAEWVLERGWIEVGQDDFSRSLIRVLDIGGMIWEGENSYDTLNDAFQAAEDAINEWLLKNG